MKESIYKSIIGNLRLIAQGYNLIYCNWEDDECSKKLNKTRKYALDSSNLYDEKEEEEKEVLKKAEKELDLYFKGMLREFTVPLTFYGTDFERDVWVELNRVDFGEKISYKELGDHVGKVSAARAVAKACGANPLAIIIPCHRVIKSNGELGGYTGGLFRKKFLLDYESRIRKGDM